MTLAKSVRLALCSGLIVTLAACGGSKDAADETGRRQAKPEQRITNAEDRRAAANGSIFNLFGNSIDPSTTVEVNKYIWQASLEVLNFLPIETVDPFTGVIVTGYGHPPGGGRAYRATIYVQDPALEARSLKIAMQGQGGSAVAPETIRAVEDAILTRARQLRIRDSKL
ncbi:DUF3576 domain-containing protein [Xinfangfangia sp. D13-10-4-6]|uniref:DUF3576 domain-containing protein n=1 Tax=Pseudogemmobacter hezensis TaxID=2737662 RepID=UPI0015551ACD|nr:DUF3576 domain-containing protein [Pseudogemmobacter hezensis]NPD14260.1 DUF3576 domain-containing protein [Pseudogemmobacter hezensis]